MIAAKEVIAEKANKEEIGFDEAEVQETEPNPPVHPVADKVEVAEDWMK
jgi:hypothetical protein